MEELIDKFNFEVSQVESCVIVAVILISEVQHHLVPFALLAGVDELVNEPIAQMLDIVMARHQVVKLEAQLVRNIQVSYCFLFVRNQDALNGN